MAEISLLEKVPFCMGIQSAPFGRKRRSAVDYVSHYRVGAYVIVRKSRKVLFPYIYRFIPGQVSVALLLGMLS